MKRFKILGIFMLAIMLAMPIGCGGKVAAFPQNLVNFVTGTCNWLAPYQAQVKVAWDNIRALYPMYEAIVTGKTNALASEVTQARAWIAAADKVLTVLGAVMNGVCRSVTQAEVEKALAVSNETLPKTEIPQAKMMKLRMMK
jgi:hypothetical protein